MGKLILFNLINENPQQGFSILVTIYEEDSRKILNKVSGKLAANPDLENKYLSWQIPYRKLINDSRSSQSSIESIDQENKIEESRRNLVSEVYAAKKELNTTINDWLKREGEFSQVCREIDRTLKDEEEEIRLIFDTKTAELQKIPFFLWKDFFAYYHRAEAGLYLPVKNSIRNIKKERVKIIAVFGSEEHIGKNTEIGINQDWETIKEHLSTESNADLIRLQEPTLDELGDSIEAHCPQIIFFAGHSFSDLNSMEGQIQLNKKEYITIHDLKYDLKKAAKKGLKLAIFNSCDGMGIARQLEDVGISNIIVMREPVPDEVAHRFLRRFLERFAFGKSINLAVRRGREKLQRLERKYPGVVCLPVLWQNPAEPPLTWEQLGGAITNKNNQNSILWQDTEVNDFNSINKELEDRNLSKSFLEAEELQIAENYLEIKSTNKDLSGTVLRDRYKIIKFIDKGSFARIYLAIDLEDREKKVVVKHLYPSHFYLNSPYNNISRLFKSEANLLYRLDRHDCIPRLYSHFEEKGNFFLVQELIDGKNLSLEFQSENRWSEVSTIKFIQELLEILVCVHQENIIHCDIKPSNIIRKNSNEKLFLIDFGAAKEVFTSNSEEEKEMTVIIGSPAYSSPEQLKGKSGKYSDIYAVGLLGIQALTGLSLKDIPHKLEELEKMWQDQKIDAKPKLKCFLNRMVSINYKNRFLDATQALNALVKLENKQNNILIVKKYLSKYITDKIFLYFLSTIICTTLSVYLANFFIETFIDNLPAKKEILE